jgi:hypothetical protein
MYIGYSTPKMSRIYESIPIIIARTKPTFSDIAGKGPIRFNVINVVAIL